MKRHGISLVEVLIVIAIVAILAAIIYPMYARAKRASQQSACINNLRQISGAFQLYMADFDDRWPLGVDPADKFTPQIWDAFPEFRARIVTLPLMHELMTPYLPSLSVWRCPSDKGQEVDDTSFELLPASPSSYATYGSSYYYRTELTLRSLMGTSLQDPASINVYFDGSGAWHTGVDILRRSDGLQELREKLRQYRYNVLFADMHVKNISRAQYDEAWDQDL